MLVLANKFGINKVSTVPPNINHNFRTKQKDLSVNSEKREDSMLSCM